MRPRVARWSDRCAPCARGPPGIRSVLRAVMRARAAGSAARGASSVCASARGLSLTESVFSLAPLSTPGCGAFAESSRLAAGSGVAAGTDCAGPARERNATPAEAPSAARSTPTAIMLPKVLLPAERAAPIARATAREIIRLPSKRVRRTMRGMTGSARSRGNCSGERVNAMGSATGVADIVRNSTDNRERSSGDFESSKHGAAATFRARSAFFQSFAPRNRTRS
jgi:hypothetical protein